MAETRIGTERLTLRDWREGDFDALFALCNDPAVMRTIGPVLSRQETRTMLDRLQQRREDFGHTFWAVERREDARVIGFCGAIRADVSIIAGELEIGWRFASDCWGQGYATEAARATVGWLAAHRPDEPIYAITAVINTRSRALMERLGMQRRVDMDFEHPKVPDDSPLKSHVTYQLEPSP